MKRSRATESNHSVFTESAVLYLLLGFLLLGFLISCDRAPSTKQLSEQIDTANTKPNTAVETSTAKKITL